jgi:hypothetical protein
MEELPLDPRHQAADDPENGERDTQQEHDPVPMFDGPDTEEQKEQDIQNGKAGNSSG